MYRTALSESTKNFGSKTDRVLLFRERNEEATPKLMTNTSPINSSNSINRFPIKKFSNKKLVSSTPSSPDTNRLNYKGLTNSNEQSLKTHLKDSIYYNNENPLSFLNNCNHKRKITQNKENLYFSGNSTPLYGNSSRQSLVNTNALTLQQITTQLKMLNERVSKNQTQMNQLRCSQLVSSKQLDAQDVSLMFRDKSKNSQNQEVKCLRIQTDGMKAKIKECQRQIVLCLPRKDFDFKIQGLQWKLKSSTPSLQKTQIELLVLAEIDKYKRQIQEQILSKVKEITKENSNNKAKWRSNKFAIKSHSFRYKETLQKIDGKEAQTHERSGFSQIPNPKQATITQQIYHIDPDGCLLDSDNCYLLDNDYNQIRLTLQDLSLLKSFGVKIS